jgi:hypothetical protein
MVLYVVVWLWFHVLNSAALSHLHHARTHTQNELDHAWLDLALSPLSFSLIPTSHHPPRVMSVCPQNLSIGTHLRTAPRSSSSGSTACTRYFTKTKEHTQIDETQERKKRIRPVQPNQPNSPFPTIDNDTPHHEHPLPTNAPPPFYSPPKTNTNTHTHLPTSNRSSGSSPPPSSSARPSSSFSRASTTVGGLGILATTRSGSGQWAFGVGYWWLVFG